MSVHIGNAIKQRMDALGMPVNTLATRIGVHRNTMADILDGNTIDTGRLKKISEQLEWNFFRILSDELERETPKLSVVREPESSGYKKRVLVPVITEVDANNPEEQALTMEFARKLKEIQERKS